MARSTFGVRSSRPILGVDDDATPAVAPRPTEPPKAPKPKRVKRDAPKLNRRQRRYIEARKAQGTWEERKPARAVKASEKPAKPRKAKPATETKRVVRNVSVAYSEPINATQSNAALSTAWEGGYGFYNA